MNEVAAKQFTGHATTQAAEGLPRLKWSISRFDALVQYGILSENDRIELVGGELVPMAPKGNRHDLVRDELQDLISQKLQRSNRLSCEIGWRPDEHTYLEPDILIYPRGFFGVSVQAENVIVLIEVADTSLSYDLKHKSDVYASLGVREYWVVNARTLETIVHLKPGAEGYGDIQTVPAADVLKPQDLPELSFSLGELKLD